MSELARKRTLIVGDVGAGKTKMTKKLLEEALSLDLGSITVVDMAPEARLVQGVRIGGSLLEENVPSVRVLRNSCMKMPRISSKDAKELMEQALHNAVVAEGLLEQFRAEPSPVLFINDVSIYLQLGDLERLWETIVMADTVVANGYLGAGLRHDHGSGISEREREAMEKLADRFNVVVRL